jgi:hypothetical protein
MMSSRRFTAVFDGTLSDRVYQRFEALVLGEEQQRAGTGRLRTGPAVFGFSRFLQACGFLSIAHTLTTLKTKGVLIHLGGPIGTDILAVICLAVAWFLFLGAAIILIPKALTAVRLPRLRSAAATLLWSLTAAALTAFSLFGSFMTIVADTTYRSIQSPDGAHRLLILDSSFLLVGRHDIYEPSCGPVLDLRAAISTNNGYDPFKDGQYSVEWSGNSATISYVFDYMDPDERRQVTVPLGAGGTCGQLWPTGQ